MRGTERRGADDGFTLVEVVVSLVLLGIVATAAAYFFIEGTRTTSNLQRTQNAVTVANEAMEMAYAIEPRDSLAVSEVPSIVVGRTQTEVEAAWSSATALGVEGVADTYPLWDPTATAASHQVLKINDDRNHSGINYEMSILVGSCFRSSNVLNTDQVCTLLPGHTVDPGDAATPSGMVRMLRVIAIVTWKPTAGECPADTCSYQLSGFMDRSDDLEWNQVIDPIAVDDYETFEQAESRVIDVMANDLIGPVSSNPVTILSSPSAGVASAGVDGKVTYTAPNGASGIFTFTYRLKDARGAQSDPATISITVPPQSSADAATASLGLATSIAVTANDKGSPVSVEITSPPSQGSVTVSGLNAVYTGAAVGTDSFRYRYTDGSGQVSPEATVTVLVDSLVNQDSALDVWARSASTEEWTDLTSVMLGTNTDPATLRINLVGARPPGTLRVLVGGTWSTSATTGSAFEYSPPRNVIGESSFQYTLTRTTSGATSDAKTMTIRVLPKAVDDNFGVLSDNTTQYLRIGINDAPQANYTSPRWSPVGVRVVEGNIATQKWTGTMTSGSCTFHGTQNGLDYGLVRVTIPYGSGTCSFGYSLVGTGSLAGLQSEPAVVTFSYR